MPTSDHKRKSEDPKVSEDTKRRKINDVDSDYSSSGNESDLELGSLDFLNKPPQVSEIFPSPYNYFLDS